MDGKARFERGQFLSRIHLVYFPSVDANETGSTYLATVQSGIDPTIAKVLPMTSLPLLPSTPDDETSPSDIVRFCRYYLIQVQTYI